jgi:uridylate kinase
MESIVVSIGGSIFVPGKEQGIDHIRALAKVIGDCATDQRRIAVTVGGGDTARRYIEWGKAIGCDEFTLDEVGIAITRVNAFLFIMALQGCDVAPCVMEDIPEAAMTLQTQHEIVVMGGTHPGHTTDAVAAMMAEKVRSSEVVNATVVAGVYEEDPKKNPKAKMFKKMRYDDLLHLLMKHEHEAGANLPFDALGVRILKRSKIRLKVVDGRDLKNLKSAIVGGPFRGTEVGP